MNIACFQSRTYTFKLVAKLKSLIAVLFIFIAVFGASASFTAVCIDFSRELVGSVDHDHARGEAQNSSADHNHEDPIHEISHSCHLGHCPFLLSPSVSFSSDGLVVDFCFSNDKLVLSGFKTILLRPPIS